MCGHDWVVIGDVSVCKRCGTTVTYDGKVLFDRKFANINNKKRRKKKNAQK